MLSYTISETIRRLLLRQFGTRLRGRVGVEVLEARCLLTGEMGAGAEMPEPNPLPPESSLPGTSGGDSTLSGSGTSTPQDSLSGSTGDPGGTTPDGSVAGGTSDSLPAGNGDEPAIAEPLHYADIPEVAPPEGTFLYLNGIYSQYREGAYWVVNLPDEWWNRSYQAPNSYNYSEEDLYYGEPGDEPEEEQEFVYGEDGIPVGYDPVEWQKLLDHTARMEQFEQDMIRMAAGEDVDWYGRAYPNPPREEEPADDPVVEAAVVPEVTIHLSAAETVHEDDGWGTFTVQISSVGLDDQPIEVWVGGYHVGYHRSTTFLGQSLLTFRPGQHTKTVTFPLMEDGDWHPDYSLRTFAYLKNADLKLSEQSVTNIETAIIEDDPYQDPDRDNIDYTEFWLTEEAAQLRASPDAAWYATWLPIYPPDPEEVWDETSEDQSEPPITETEPPTQSDQSSQPIIASAPAPDLSSSSASDTPVTAPAPVVVDSGSTSSPLEATTVLANVATDSGSSNDTSLTTIETSTGGAVSNSGDVGSTIVTTNGSGETSSVPTLETPPVDGLPETSTSFSTLADSSEAASSTSSSSTESSSDSLADTTSSDDLFVESANSTSVVDLLLMDGDSLESGSSADPVLGEEAQLYVDSDGDVVLV